MERLADHDPRGHEPTVPRLDTGRAGSGRGQLRFVCTKELGSILRGRRREWIVAVPEQLEERVVLDDRRIERELDRLGMVADVLVRRRSCRAAGIADLRAKDSIETPEPGVGSPESPEREGEVSQPVGGGEIDRGGHAHHFAPHAREPKGVVPRLSRADRPDSRPP